MATKVVRQSLDDAIVAARARLKLQAEEKLQVECSWIEHLGDESIMLKKFIQELYEIWITERPTQLAAALAFTSMFSFAPVIFIVVSIMGIFADEIEISTQMYQRLQSV